MKRIFALTLILLLLVGCGKPVSSWQPTAPQDIPGMPGCTYQVIESGLNVLQVIRCKNESVSTTYQEGKTSKSINVVDNQ